MILYCEITSPIIAGKICGIEYNEEPGVIWFKGM
jgi:hypothetical protein